MQIIIKTEQNERFALTVNSSDTIEMVKIQIQNDHDISVDQQKLMYGRIEMENNETLQKYNITENFILQLKLKKETCITISVTMSDETFDLDVETNDDIVTVKAKIEEQELYLQCEQQLYYRDVELDDHKTLAYYNIQQDDNLVLKLSIPPCTRIYISKGLNESKFPLGVYPDDNIDLVKAKIQAQEGTFAFYQRLIFNGKELQNGHKLSEYGIKKDSVLHLVFTNMQICVNVFTTETITIDVKPNDSIISVKEKIEKKNSQFAAERQILKYNNQMLEDTKLLSHYKIENSATLRMEMQIHVLLETLDGAKLALLVDPDNTIDNLKKFANDVHGVDKNAPYMFKGKTLQSGVLKNLNIVHGSIIQAAWRLEGGNDRVQRMFTEFCKQLHKRFNTTQFIPLTFIFLFQ